MIVPQVRRAGWIAAALLLGGCQLPADIHVVQACGRVGFIVKANSKPGCLHGLDVRAADGGARLWQVSADFDGPCVSRIVYGRASPSYDQTAPAQPLVRGRRYEVSASGVGFTAQTIFVAQ